MFDFRISIYFALSLLIFFPINLMAENKVRNTNEFTALEWLNKDKEFSRWCKQTSLVSNARVFNDTMDKGNNLRVDYCNKEISEFTELQTRILDLLDDLGRLFPSSNLYTRLRLEALKRLKESGEIAQFEVLDDRILAISLDSIVPLSVHNDVLDECNTSAKAISIDSDCKAALIEFGVIYNFAQSTLAQPSAFELSKRLSLLEQKWDEFYNESKSQTIWELSINGALFQKENKEHVFADPPSLQLVVMHPTVVIENVADAVDGEQLKQSIMIEVIGADWWKQDKWFFPSGGAIIATYSDRSGVDDWGYGVSLNFESKFTLGASDHGGDIGFFITIDFLKLIQDKTSTIKKYID
jgi:hypothetical protein